MATIGLALVFFVALGLARSARLFGMFGLLLSTNVLGYISIFGVVSNICLRVGNDGFGLLLFDFVYKS